MVSTTSVLVMIPTSWLDLAVPFPALSLKLQTGVLMGTPL
jgi:hypothetical protein